MIYTNKQRSMKKHENTAIIKNNNQQTAIQ